MPKLHVPCKECQENKEIFTKLDLLLREMQNILLKQRNKELRNKYKNHEQNIR